MFLYEQLGFSSWVIAFPRYEADLRVLLRRVSTSCDVRLWIDGLYRLRGIPRQPSVRVKRYWVTFDLWSCSFSFRRVMRVSESLSFGLTSLSRCGDFGAKLFRFYFYFFGYFPFRFEYLFEIHLRFLYQLSVWVLGATFRGQYGGLKGQLYAIYARIGVQLLSDCVSSRFEVVF